MKSMRLIAVWLLLLALPVQGLAAFSPSASCTDSPASAHVTQSPHSDSHQHHSPSAQHEHPADQQHDDSQPADQAGHSCCHHVFSGLPSTVIPGTPAPPLAVTPRVLLLSTLFIPELPQRPPRA